MKLKDLIKTNLNIEISNVCTNSKDCTKNSIFFCTVGKTYDSHIFVNEAIKNGAVFVVSSKKLDITVPYIVVKNIDYLLTDVTNKFYNIDSLVLVGVTGTDGKTTTSLISKHLLSSKYNVGYIGTNGVMFNDQHITSNNTTPSNLELFKYLSLMKDSGVQIVVLEVSSHAIALGRIANLNFDASILTNITRDHLDFHKTMSNYTNTKLELFKNKDTYSIINKDLPKIKTIEKKININEYYSLDELKETKVSFNSLEFNYRNHNFFANLGFEFNLYNILASIKLCEFFNIDLSNVKEKLKTIPHIDGRQVLIDNVIVDFAHTPNAILSVLESLSKITNKKIITVLGACGNRDQKKRPLMGKIASENSFLLIITDEDPKYEDASSIRKDLISGIENSNYIEIANRVDAINYSISISDNNDAIVLILGKGNEDTQDFGNIKKEHNDIRCVLQILNNF